MMRKKRASKMDLPRQGAIFIPDFPRRTCADKGKPEQVAIRSSRDSLERSRGEDEI
jgi:hypothetical protein